MSSRVGLLRHPSDLVSTLETRDRWLLSRMLDDNFWNGEPVNVASPFGDDDDNTPLSQLMYQPALVDTQLRGYVCE